MAAPRMAYEIWKRRPSFGKMSDVVVVVVVVDAREKTN